MATSELFFGPANIFDCASFSLFTLHFEKGFFKSQNSVLAASTLSYCIFNFNLQNGTQIIYELKVWIWDIVYECPAWRLALAASSSGWVTTPHTTCTCTSKQHLLISTLDCQPLFHSSHLSNIYSSVIFRLWLASRLVSVWFTQVVVQCLWIYKPGWFSEYDLCRFSRPYFCRMVFGGLFKVMLIRRCLAQVIQHSLFLTGYGVTTDTSSLWLFFPLLEYVYFCYIPPCFIW